jgi:hypothetical protein
MGGEEWNEAVLLIRPKRSILKGVETEPSPLA